MLIELYYDYLEDCTKFMTMEDIDVTYGGKAYTIPKGTTSDGASIPEFVPKGTTSDGASIPEFAQSICMPFDRPLHHCVSEA